jgi:hypothetical protein
MLNQQATNKKSLGSNMMTFTQLTCKWSYTTLVHYFTSLHKKMVVIDGLISSPFFPPSPISKRYRYCNSYLSISENNYQLIQFLNDLLHTLKYLRLPNFNASGRLSAYLCSSSILTSERLVLVNTILHCQLENSNRGV